jgi:hypothetical protein
LPAHLAVVAGKDGRIQVLDSDRLEKGAVQVLPAGRGVYAAAAYWWNGHVFISASEDELHDFALVNGQLSDRPVASGTQRLPNPGATPVLSTNGTRNAIVWLIETKVWNDYTPTKHSVLHAYDGSSGPIHTIDSRKTEAMVEPIAVTNSCTAETHFIFL